MLAPRLLGKKDIIMMTTEKMPKTFADEIAELTGRCVSLIERMAIVATKRIEDDGDWKDYCKEYDFDDAFWGDCVDEVRTDTLKCVKDLAWYMEGLVAMVEAPYNENV